MGEKELDLSILIVNWNTWRYLEPCLESIIGVSHPFRYEVIVVDNDSGDGSADRIRERFPTVRLIANDENLGFAAGNNQAYAASVGRTVLILNPDTVIRDDALAHLVEFVDDQSDAGIVSAGLVNPDGSYQHFFGRLPTIPIVAFCYTGVGILIDRMLLGGRFRRHQLFGELGEIDRVTARTDGAAGFACTIMRRDVIEEVGFMDEAFPLFFNDGDLAARLLKAGYRAYLLPDAHVMHHVGSATSQISASAFSEAHVVGLRRYLLKHHGRRTLAIADLIFHVNYLALLGFSVIKILLHRKSWEDLSRDWKLYRAVTARKAVDVQFLQKGGSN